MIRDISHLPLATDLMFLLWNINNRTCRVCDRDLFKRYLPFTSSSCAKDERHVYSQRVSSSRRDPFPHPHLRRTAAHTAIAEELPMAPHIITPLLLRQLALWERKRVGGSEKEAVDHLSSVCHSLGMVGCRMKSVGLTHPDSSAAGGEHAQRGSPIEHSPHYNGPN